MRFEKPRHVQRFLGAYAAPAPVFLFTLWAPLAVVERRERERKHRSRLGARVAACHLAMEQRLAELGEVIENVTAPAEVAAKIDRRSLAGGR